MFLPFSFLRSPHIHEAAAPREIHASRAFQPVLSGPEKGKYEVKWAGYSTDENTWEPTENLEPGQIAEYESGYISNSSGSDGDGSSE